MSETPSLRSIQTSRQALYINYKADRLTLTEKQQLLVDKKEVPPNLEPPIDFEEEVTESRVEEVEKTDQAQVSSEPAAEKIDGKVSGKGKEAAKEPAPTESEWIFAGCGSFEKL